MDSKPNITVVSELDSSLQSTPDWHHDNQIVLVLVGLIASGKSTFSTALEAHVPSFRRYNQDELKNRRAVENSARRSLQEGFSVCIDRTNIDESQRAHWVTIAREVPNTAVWCLIFDIPSDVCAMRLRTRVDHPTIKSAEQGVAVLHRFASQYQAPTHHEGFDRILHMKASDHLSPHYTKADILLILRNIRGSPPSLAYDPPRPGTIDQYFSEISGSSSGVNSRVINPQARQTKSPRLTMGDQPRGSFRRRGFSATENSRGRRGSYSRGLRRANFEPVHSSSRDRRPEHATAVGSTSRAAEQPRSSNTNPLGGGSGEDPFIII